MKIDTDKSYLMGLLIGGGVIHGKSLQIVLPYKKWGDLQINPARAGDIAEDILKRLNPIWQSCYNMNVTYKIGTDWKINCSSVSEELLTDLKNLGLPVNGELRTTAQISALAQCLKSLLHRRSFIAGLVDTIGSLAKSHRRFVNEFQIISFEFKGNNFSLVQDVVKLLIDSECVPDQVLWNHPNQHSGQCRYYKSWKKGFKIRVALDDYMIQPSFVFKSKQSSAKENQELQSRNNNTSIGKTSKVSGRVTIHKDQFNHWLPKNIRGFQFIHYLHFYRVFDIPINEKIDIDSYLNSFEKYFCPFTCLTKGTIEDIVGIIHSESYLAGTVYTPFVSNVAHLLDMLKCKSEYAFGKTNRDGFPLNLIKQGLAYVLAATNDCNIKGKRVLGDYKDILEKFSDSTITVCKPNKGTCLLIKSDSHAALIGYINDAFNKDLIVSNNQGYVLVREPSLDECVSL